MLHKHGEHNPIMQASKESAFPLVKHKATDSHLFDQDQTDGTCLNKIRQMASKEDSGHSHDALHATILSKFFAHVISHLNLTTMDTVRFAPYPEGPLDVSKLLYLHCIDLKTKKFTPVSSFSCLEVLCVHGHFSFAGEW